MMRMKYIAMLDCKQYIEETFKVGPPNVKCEASDGPLLPETDIIQRLSTVTERGNDKHLLCFCPRIETNSTQPSTSEQRIDQNMVGFWKATDGKDFLEKKNDISLYILFNPD